MEKKEEKSEDKPTRLEELEKNFEASKKAHQEITKRLQLMVQQEQALAKQCYELQIRIDEHKQLNNKKE